MAVGEPYGANRYIKGHTLGEGTYGVVFKAIDKVVTNQLLLLDNADSHCLKSRGDNTSDCLRCCQYERI